MLRNFLYLILLFFTTTPPCGLLAQTNPGAIIAGKVFDRETGNPLENAIVFLANTPIGTSSSSDGTFRISLVPVGVYQMIISRVGYDREVRNLDVTKSESLYFEIKLQPKPVRTKEVEVVGKRPEGMKPEQYSFFPKESPNTYCIYGAGSSTPIGIFFSDSAFYMYALDTAIVDSEKYIRLWLLYKNLSQTPYDLEPVECAKLHMHGKLCSYKDILPESSPRMLVRMDNEKLKDDANKKIGKILSAFATIQTSSADLEEYFNRWGPRMEGIFAWVHGKFGPSTKGALSADLYTIFSTSLNSGVLRKYEVYPDNSVNGLIYFPFPGLNWKATASVFPEAAEYVYTIEIITQNGSKYIDFVPH